MKIASTSIARLMEMSLVDPRDNYDDDYYSAATVTAGLFHLFIYPSCFTMLFHIFFALTCVWLISCSFSLVTVLSNIDKPPLHVITHHVTLRCQVMFLYQNIT